MVKGVVCKRCDGKNIEYRKSWKMKAGRSGIAYDVELWYCEDCKKTFRNYVKVE